MNIPKWRRLRPHKLAEIIPGMTEAEFEELCSDMKEDGYDKKQPVLLFEGKILDGIHRHRAAIRTGAEPSFDEYKGNDPSGIVRRRNLNRRHLSAGQRSFAAVELAKLGTHGGDRRSDQAAKLPLETQEQLAEEAGVSERTVRDASKVLTEGTEELQEGVRNGTISVSDAAKIVDQPPAKQRAAVKKVKSGKAKTASAAAGKKAKPKSPDKKSKEMHDCLGKLVRYADDLASGKPKFSSDRDTIHKHLQAAKNGIVALERSCGIK